ncbi:MAG: hypothetical protein R3Y05_01970 [bacterium]
MKKLFCITVVSLIVFLSSMETKEVEASSDSHLTFQKMDIHGGQLLRDYTEEEIEDACSELDGRQFWGWDTKAFTNNAEVHFTSHTIFSYYNAGTTAIKHKYTSTVTTTKKISFDSTGSVGFDVSGTVKGFKGGLDTSLKLNFKYEESETDVEKIEIDFSCDPGTRVLMYVVGEGTLCNGVANRYMTWIKVGEGGYEYFITQTMYQVLEKVEI